MYMTIRYLSICCMNTDAKADARQVELMKARDIDPLRAFAPNMD